jgi:hypothetical protein
MQQRQWRWQVLWVQIRKLMAKEQGQLQQELVRPELRLKD